jgi:hypothetical protein
MIRGEELLISVVFFQKNYHNISVTMRKTSELSSSTGIIENAIPPVNVIEKKQGKIGKMSQISGNKTNVTTICNMGVLV